MTSERIDPNLDRNVMKLSRLAHIKRYLKAADYVKPNHKILDAGCGYGYGSHILSKRSHSVLGIDVSPEAIEVAKERYNHDVEYCCGDIQNFDFSRFAPFDIVTLFEVLEHLGNSYATIGNIRKCMSSEGRLFVSVPNGRNASPNNDFHTVNFTQEDVEELLQNNGFCIEERLGQYPLLGGLAELMRKITGYASNTDKKSGLVPQLIDSVPFLPEVFSGLYRDAQDNARTLYYVARCN